MIEHWKVFGWVHQLYFQKENHMHFQNLKEMVWEIEFFSFWGHFTRYEHYFQTFKHIECKIAFFFCAKYKLSHCKISFRSLNTTSTCTERVCMVISSMGGELKLNRNFNEYQPVALVIYDRSMFTCNLQFDVHFNFWLFTDFYC